MIRLAQNSIWRTIPGRRGQSWGTCQVSKNRSGFAHRKSRSTNRKWLEILRNRTRQDARNPRKTAQKRKPEMVKLTGSNVFFTNRWFCNHYNLFEFCEVFQDNVCNRLPIFAWFHLPSKQCSTSWIDWSKPLLDQLLLPFTFSPLAVPESKKEPLGSSKEWKSSLSKQLSMNVQSWPWRLSIWDLKSLKSLLNSVWKVILGSFQGQINFILTSTRRF